MNMVTDPNLMHYTIQYENYNIDILGENHFNDYHDFIKNLKNFLRVNFDKKYIIVLELNENWPIQYENGKITSRESQHSISHLLAKDIYYNEFKDFSNVEFIYGDTRTEEFNDILYRLEDNISDFPEYNVQEKLDEEDDDRLLDIFSIKSYWEDELKLFEGEEYDGYKEEINNLLSTLNSTLKFKDLEFYLAKFWYYWIILSDIWALNKIKDYLNSDNNILIITGEMHVFDYVYHINKKYPSINHFICNNYRLPSRNLVFLYNKDPPYFSQAIREWYYNIC